MNLVLEDNLLFYYLLKKWQTHKNKEGGETLEIFTVNPSFLKEIWKDNECNLFDFHFELFEDGSLKQAYYKDTKLEPAIWQWLFKVRHEYIKQKRKAESNYAKKINAIEERENYKELLHNQTKKQIEHRKQIEYKERTIILYRRILEKLCLKEWDQK